MSGGTLVFLTVAEILLLVIVLAIFLIRITGGLKRISATLAKVAFGVRAVELQVAVIGPGVTTVNRTLSEIAGVLPGIAERAEELASRR